MASNHKISISIVTATWNCVDTLSDCFASISQQDYEKYEHIVIDGASTDGTIDIINQQRNKISAFISEVDTGVYDALNKGIQLSTGDVIGFLHSDDSYASINVLTRIAKAFEDPSVCAIYGDLEYVSKEDKSKVIRRWRSKKFSDNYLHWGWMPPHPTLYVRKDWYSRIGNFDTSYSISADYHNILKLFAHRDFKTVYLPHTIIKMRLGGLSNKSLSAIFKKSMEDWRALRSCSFSPLNALFVVAWKNLSKLTQLI
jgi:glycosyltransferase involved in cell wall biosynthesis